MTRKLKSVSIILSFLVLFTSCTSQKYFFDTESSERQKELKKHRSGNVFGDIGLMIASLFVMATLEVDAGFYPEGQEFKKLKLINPTKDTIYVNMLTDVYWDEQNFCDFMDIRIPPHQKCTMLVPVNADYNVYFSNTPEEEDDEMLEINTDAFKRLSLYPGLTVIED
ncbi:hypothetical protein [Maribellus maritimus]|uniref:hypothetical protein n=1 Tax=Maribellus maritimus TaxID=2870838 RepID=UPI001EE9BA35|nr:hypothetical protein [Maribellus maritimus]MCG6187683.1 hypothetical protein [Maribellus maritimus]